MGVRTLIQNHCLSMLLTRLQRFQSSHRSRAVAGGGPGGVLESVTRAPSVRSLSLGDSGHLPDMRGLDSYGGHRTLQRLSSG